MPKPKPVPYVPGPAGGAYAFYNYMTAPKEEWKRRLAQVRAGFAENIYENAADEGYRPAFIDQVLGIPGVVKSFTSGGQKNLQRNADTPFSGDTALERQLNRSYKGMTTAEVRANRRFNTTSPRTGGELLLRHGPTALINPSSALKKIPKVARILEKGAQVAAKAPRIITAPAKIAAEIVSPFRDTKLSTAIPVNAAVLGLTDILLDKGVTTSGEEYHGSLPKWSRDSKPAPTPEQQQSERDVEAMILQDALDNGEITQEEIEQEHLNAPVTDQEVDAAEHTDWLGKAKDAGLFLGAVTAATLGGKKLGKAAGDLVEARRAAVSDPANMGKFDEPNDYAATASVIPEDIKTRAHAEAPSDKAEGEPQFISTKHEKSDISAGERMVGQVFEQTRPIVDAANRHLGRAHAKKYQWRGDRMLNSSFQSKFVDWLVTGRAPGTDMKTEKLASWAEAYAKELSPEDQKRVGDALVAASSLDDFYRTGDRASLTKDKFGNPTDVANMQALVDSVKQDPVLAKYFNQTQKFFDEKLRFEVQRGTLTQAEYDDLRKKRPNYVPLQSNLQQEAPYSPFGQRYSANVEGLQARNLDPGAGVPGDTGVVNPFNALFEDWSDAIRRAETNEYRRDFLGDMSNAGARNSKGQLLVEDVTGKTTEGPNIHEVMTPQGKRRYNINDSVLAEALHLSPRNTALGFNEARQMVQNFTTGAVAAPFNQFATIMAPVMDSMAASTLAGKSHGVGALNRLFVGGYTGGLKTAGNMMAREFAVKLRSHMIRENSWLKNKLGPKGLDALTTMLENHYKNTTLSQMDQMGITSHAAWGSTDPSHLMQGLEGIMPGYARQQGRYALDELNTALQNGDVGKLGAALRATGNLGVQAKSLPILRHYGALLQGLHNGARATAFGANKGKVKDLDEFISDMRRLSADPAQHGSSKYVDYATSANMYGPISMQTMAQIGRRFREDPVNFLRNYAQTGMTAAAMFYLSQAYDQDARDAHAAKTPQQRANKLSMFGGAELPLDQSQRLLLGSVMPLIDNMLGVNKGEFDGDIMKVFHNMIEGRTPDMSEADWKEQEMRINEGIRSNIPTSLAAFGLNYKPDGSVGYDWKPDPSSIPPLAAGLTMFGIDPGLSALTGEATGPRTQKITGAGDEMDRPNSMVDSQTEVMLRTLFSSAGAGILDIADDYYRAMNDDDPTNDKRAFDMALDQWKEKQQKSGGLAKPLFGDRQELKSAADVNYALLKDREKGIEEALNFLNRDYRTSTLSGASRTSARRARELDPSGIAAREDLAGTEALRIGGSARQITTELNKAKADIKHISDRIESIKASTDKKQEEKNIEINNLNDEIKFRRLHMLMSVREHERIISADLGRPFSFEDYDGGEYLSPYVHTGERMATPPE